MEAEVTDPQRGGWSKNSQALGLNLELAHCLGEETRSPGSSKWRSRRRTGPCPGVPDSTRMCYIEVILIANSDISEDRTHLKHEFGRAPESGLAGDRLPEF